MGTVLPCLAVLFLWWFTTGLILIINGLPATTFRWSMGAVSVVALGALAALAWSANQPTVTGAYVAFTAALLVWGWVETAFLLGIVTGPRRVPGTPGAGGALRFKEALGTILHHELALLTAGGLVLALTWGAANAVGSQTFLALFAMRLSTKLNVHWGVPNLPDAFLPPQLDYLRGYLRRGPMNALFPVSVTLGTLATGWAAADAHAALSSFDYTAAVLLTVLLGLGVLEHWFLVMPLPATAPWQWALGNRTRSDMRTTLALSPRG